MDLEERTLDDTLVLRCQVCGAQMTSAEIESSREAGGPVINRPTELETTLAGLEARLAGTRRPIENGTEA